MSAELLMNFDKTVSNKTNNESTSLNRNTTKEKKEGSSLFDSLMNEAKIESKSEEKIATKNTDKINESKTEEKTATKNTNNTVESTTDEKIKNNDKSVTKKDVIQIKEKTNSLDLESSDTKDSLSVKKMVEKLVDIVVNAAKEMFDKNDGESVDSKKLKNAVEDIVDSKLNNIADKDKLKTIIDKKLDIVKDSIDIIKKETTNVTTNKDLEIDDDSNTEQAKKSKEIIQNEVIIIKDNVKEIKKDVSKLKDQKPHNVDSENSNDIDKSITEKIKNNLSVISDSSDEIKTIISDIDTSNKIPKTAELLKEVDTKIEYKVETIKEAISEIKEKVLEVVIVKTTGNEIKKMESSSVNIITNIKGDVDSEKPLLASMFLNAQKSIKDKTLLEQAHDAKNNITDKKSIESVKESAKKLDLNLEKTEVNHEEEQGKKPVSTEKKEELKTNNLINTRTLNRAIIDQKIEANHVNVLRNNEISQKEIIKNSENEKKNNTEIVEMNVPKDIAQNLQNKIIGAQQKMGSFMNEVARNMYLNYKPPVTAFRVNLNPANLGTISIMLKANKVDNSLSVSMNLSNSNTMEAFTENKVALQSAIQRQFNETSNVTINFNMQDQNSENDFNQNNQNNQKNNQDKEQNADSEFIDIEDQEIIETNDYM